MAMPEGRSDVFILCANLADSSSANEMVSDLKRRGLSSLHVQTAENNWPTEMGLYITFVGKSGRNPSVANARQRSDRRIWIVFSNDSSLDDRAQATQVAEAEAVLASTSSPP